MFEDAKRDGFLKQVDDDDDIEVDDIEDNIEDVEVDDIENYVQNYIEDG